MRSARPSKNNKKHDPLGWGRRFFKKSVFLKKIGSLIGFQTGNAEGGEKKIKVFRRFWSFDVVWGQGFGGLNLVLLAWCGVGATGFVH